MMNAAKAAPDLATNKVAIGARIWQPNSTPILAKKTMTVAQAKISTTAFCDVVTLLLTHLLLAYECYAIMYLPYPLVCL